MPHILHDFPIFAPAEKVFAGVATPKGLDAWWTMKSEGKPELGSEYTLWFGPEYDWRGKITKCVPNKEIEWTITSAQEDWLGSKVAFTLEEQKGRTNIHFSHTGWNEENEHYRISSFCWAMYLRLLKRYVEFGEFVEYEKRLDV